MTEGFVSRETQSKQEGYEQLLLTWNRQLNLVGRSETRVFRSRHIPDSLALVPHLPPRIARFIDLASVAGLHGIPVAIVTGLHVDLVEVDRRKAAFLKTALATIPVRGAVWIQRIENSAVPQAPCLTARGLAPLTKLLRLAYPLLEPHGTALFIKGRRVQEEIDVAGQDWHMAVTLLPGATSESRIVKIMNLSPRACRLG